MAAQEPRSYRVMVLAQGESEWSGNALRFPDRDVAERYAVDLAGRWTAVREWRVDPSDDPVTEGWAVTMAVTVLDVAVGRGAMAVEDGGITGGEFERVGLPMLGGCEVCGASIAAYNAYPSKSGYLRCRGCVGGIGFENCAAFESWSHAEEES